MEIINGSRRCNVNRGLYHIIESILVELHGVLVGQVLSCVLIVILERFIIVVVVDNLNVLAVVSVRIQR